MINNSIIISLKDNENINDVIKDYKKEEFIHLSFDGKQIFTLNEFLEIFYRELECPDDFGKNWNAFWDTITDEEFWVKKPLIITIKNYKYLFGTNKNDKNILSDILINLLKEKRQKYYIFLK